MSIEQQENLIKKLGDLGENLPGLNEDQVTNNLVAKSAGLGSYNTIVSEEIQENIDRGMDEEQAISEANEKREEAEETLRANLKKSVTEQISIVKQEYKILKEGVERIPPDVTSIIANILLPPAIGTPPVAPNPVYALNLTKTSKNTLSGLLSSITAAFGRLLKAANEILYVLPSSLLLLFDQIANLTSLIDSIPL